MNEKLKTVDDLDVYGGDPHWHCVSKEELKAEAIKRVKECAFRDLTPCRKGNRCLACIRTKTFFNITEDDLQ